MKKHTTYSKLLHILVLLCFLLPFFYTGCGPSKEEKAQREKAKQDSIDAIQKTGLGAFTDKTSIKDSLQHDSIVEPKAALPDELSKITAGAPPEKENPKEQRLSEIITNNYPFLRPILTPKPDTFTGLGEVINSVYFITFYAILISFLMLLIGLLIKFIDRHASLTLIILDFLALAFMFFSRTPTFVCDVLWGYWVTFSLIVLLLLYDTFIVIKNKRRNKSNEPLASSPL